MEFFHGIIALLSGIVLVLSGLVAWLYIQQSRQSQAINAIAIALTTPPPSYPSADEVISNNEVPIDDRVTVEEHEDVDDDNDEEVEVVGEDMTDLKSKTVAQLREMLTEKGIPFNKSDKKGTLISLVQAAS
jgi:hypothetical protein